MIIQMGMVENLNHYLHNLNSVMQSNLTFHVLEKWKSLRITERANGCLYKCALSEYILLVFLWRILQILQTQTLYGFRANTKLCTDLLWELLLFYWGDNWKALLRVFAMVLWPFTHMVWFPLVGDIFRSNHFQVQD